MKRQAWTLLRVIMALALLLVSVGPGGRTARADELMAILGVDVENLDAPFGGEKPDYSATVEVGEGCRLGAASGEGWKNGVMWYDVTEDKPIRTSATFVSGHVYRVNVLLKADQFFTFYGEGGAVVTQARMGGVDAGIQANSEREIIVWREFTCRAPIVAVTSVEEINVGGEPNYGASVWITSEAEKYLARDLQNGSEGWVNGVRWFDVTANAPMSPETRFERGHEYAVQVLFKLTYSGVKRFESEGDAALLALVNDDRPGAWELLPRSRAALSFAYPRLPDIVVIDRVTVNGLGAPALGETPDYDVYVTAYNIMEKPNYYVEDKTHDAWKNGVCWFDVTDGEVPMLPDQTFELDHTYRATVALVAEDGYTFRGDNGHGSYIETYAYGMESRIINDRQLYVTRTYSPLRQVIYLVNVLDIDVPAADMKPDYDVTLNAVGCALDVEAGTRNGIEWCDMTDGQRTLGPDEVFLSGHHYFVRVHLAALPGYTFCDMWGNELLSIVIGDGLSGTGRVKVDEQHMSYARAFNPVAKTAGPATVTGVDAPVASNTPDYAVNVSGVGVAANAIGFFEGSLWNGVEWIDETVGAGMNREAVFEPGHQYSVRVHVRADGDYTFVNGSYQFTLSGTINGEPAQGIRYMDEKTGYLTFTFPALPGGTPVVNVVSRVLLVVDEPKAGQTPGYNFILDPITTVYQEALNDDYHRNGVSFIDRASGEAIRLDDVFEQGHAYEARFSIYAKEGFSFYDADGNLATSIAVNSRAAARVSPRDPDDPRHAVVSYTFYLPAEGHLFPANLSGFVEYNGGLFLVSGGDVVTDANGVVQDPDNPQIWYFCANGQAQMGHYGLAEYGGKWFFIRDGRLDTGYTGLVEYDGARFMVAAGRLLDEYDGLIQDPRTGLWYYVARGEVQRVTTLVLYDGAWFYVTDGELATDFTGEVEYDGASFSVVAGQVVA